MQNFKFYFLENEFQVDRVYLLSSISRTLHNFSTGLFSMYRGRLKLKNVTSILHKNGSFANHTCCGLTSLFVKTKIYFCRHCNFVDKQIKKIPSIVFSFSQQVEPKIFQKIFIDWKWNPRSMGTYKNVPVQYEQLNNSF